MLKSLFTYLFNRLNEFSFWVGVFLIVTLVVIPDGLSLFIISSVIIVQMVMPDSKFTGFINKIRKFLFY